ncbi:cysteine-rich and transmembrane domain-containing protein WIH2 [Vitis vinifera]|uniref:cysteine-rich and transmembrane domain-containing protein WIH2 n=1 Tax=Vitis vinifera TaxID=29760 RepID=UPI00053F4EAD|nr:cysteine-rich and transmembrane domain-containing protein WIH2 [Vitis vinifera]|eukprot:XP_010664503.1 PREDICTED: cysteine-rich and transmembrane domain-containing protein A-like [Vitis vinifera]
MNFAEQQPAVIGAPPPSGYAYPLVQQPQPQQLYPPGQQPPLAYPGGQQPPYAYGSQPYPQPYAQQYPQRYQNDCCCFAESCCF